MAAQYGNRIAVSAPGGEWTYEELARRADFVASEIVSKLGEDSESVALLFEHDAPLIAAILGTLKANKIYVVLEPAHSPVLLIAMLESSGAKLLLADSTNLSLAKSIASSRSTVLPVSKTLPDACARIRIPKVSGDSAAWLMFTSGSTGTPKGVWQNHRGLVQEAGMYAELAGITHNDRVALLASCSLSASSSTLFGALLGGAALYPFHARSQGIERLAAWLDEKRITILHTVPTIFRQLGRLGLKHGSFAAMRLVRLGGEPVLPSDVELFRQHWQESCQLMQSLSSTETGIICAKVINGEMRHSNGRIPVGVPVGGVEVILVDEAQRPIKNGGEGRIAVRSARLKQGYWRQPELTAEKFKSGDNNSNLRTFISNDLGRFLPDGSLEHIGRTDSVVKINGQRVDLGEWEAALLATGIAREAAVTVHEEKPRGKRLLCFFVAKPGTVPSPAEIRRLLRDKISGQMAPAEFIALDKLPLTVAGKIDRGALRAPLRWEANAILGRSHEPRDVLDKRLQVIWESALGIFPIGRRDDFFELGGTSLQSVEILAQIDELFGISLPPSTLVEYNTIEKLSDMLARRKAGFSQNVLVKLRDGGPGRPLFLIHSRQGDVGSYGFLAQRLAGRPIYGLQSPGLMGESWPVTDLRGMAELYLREILSEDSAGPYLLAGTCMGGMVALELAQMLVRQGKTVCFLGLLDVAYPLAKSWQKSLWAKVYYALSTPAFNGWQAVRWKSVRSLGLGRSDHFLPAYRRFVARTNGNAFRNYKPENYPGKITFFITTETKNDGEDPRLMLLPIAQTAEVIKISGVRAELFQKPVVDELAERLLAAMDSSENSTR